MKIASIVVYLLHFLVVISAPFFFTFTGLERDSAFILMGILFTFHTLSIIDVEKLLGRLLC